MMRNSEWKLFEPLTIKGLRFKNRIVMLPLANKLHSITGEVTQRLIDYYIERARGGAGLIIVQLSTITTDLSSSRLNISLDDYIAGLNDLAEAIKLWGCSAAIQIGHRGSWANKRMDVNKMGMRDIEDMTDAFGLAAGRARRSGFEAVEIHGAHGYLVAQFMSGFSNKRADDYGGSLEKRMVFPVKVVRRVREAVGDNFPISFRLSCTELLQGGMTVEDSKMIAAILEKEGVDIISVSAGRGPESREWTVQPMAMERGCLVPMAEEIKRSIHIPVLVGGRINDAYLANEILEEGKADLVGMGRPLVADPWLPDKALGGRLDEIRKCIACNYCHGKRVTLGLPIRCAVNPEAGREKRKVSVLAKNRKKILIAGGGAAGLECAHVLAEAGHEVLLFEKGEELGGKLRLAALPPNKGEINELTEYLIRRLQKGKAGVFLNYEVKEETIEETGVNVFVCATGAAAVTPEVIGLREDAWCMAEEVLLGYPTGHEIVIIGGGLVGCETAEFLITEGKRVTVIERLPSLCEGIEPITRKLLLGRLKKGNVNVCIKSLVHEAIGDKLIYRNESSLESQVSFDTLVFATGYMSNDRLYKAITKQKKGVKVFSIGDCKTPRGIYDAIHEGHMTGCMLS